MLTLSDKLEELYNLASPQVQIASKGGLLEIQFDFQDIAQEEIDQAMQALVDNQDFYIDSSNQVYFFDEETKKNSPKSTGTRTIWIKKMGPCRLENP